ncbi:hypothetical protein EDD86DRAFT_274184 [Gorgonomyces haynaldii]|nr:hypothetical protein EDD86DRAFT_274184 [Gorgonomyces haynaldii]
MAPTITPISFVSKPVSPKTTLKKDIDSFSIIGSANHPDFLLARGLLHTAKVNNPSKLDYVETEYTPFDFEALKLKYKTEHPQYNLQGIAIRANNKLLELEELKQLLAKKYSIGESKTKQVNEYMEQLRIQDTSKILQSHRDYVFLEFAIDNVPIGTISIELFTDICPILVKRFVDLVRGLEVTYGQVASYKGAKIERIVKNGWIQTGTPDENFIVKHSKRGIVSMVNTGPNSNQAPFMITLKPMPYFDHKYVAIGQLVDGEQTLRQIEQVPTQFEQPLCSVEIVQVGEISLSKKTIKKETPKSQKKPLKPSVAGNESQESPSKRLKKDASDSKPTTPKKANLLQEAKSLFRRCSTPSRLVGREQERSVLESFLENVKNQTGGSLYISGLEFKVERVTINCMGVKDPKHIFVKIGQDLKLNGDPQRQLETLFQNSRKMFVVVLDEIDQLSTLDQQVLYKLFEMAKQPGSRLCLVGIANAIDFTTRFLPRLEAKNLEPIFLVFQPYSVKEISSIIKSRLNTLKPHGFLDQNDVPVMHPMAVELAARKIADSGDLRKALDVCRQAIEHAETEFQNKTDVAPKVTVKHVLQATNAALGSQSIVRIRGLQMQPKLVLLTLSMLTMRNSKDITFGKVQEAYLSVCKHNTQVAAVEPSEFKDLMMLLEANGLAKLTAKKPKDPLTNHACALSIGTEESSTASL